MHKHGYFHRDMKPENLLVGAPNVNLGRLKCRKRWWRFLYLSLEQNPNWPSTSPWTKRSSSMWEMDTTWQHLRHCSCPHRYSDDLLCLLAGLGSSVLLEVLARNSYRERRCPVATRKSFDMMAETMGNSSHDLAKSHILMIEVLIFWNYWRALKD